MSEETPLLWPLISTELRQSSIAIHDFLGRHGQQQPTHRIEGHGHISRWRSATRGFLSSRWGHYLVIALVVVDVVCIIADFLIKLHNCEVPQPDRGWTVAQTVLSKVSLGFSTAFVVELMLSLLSFGLSYLKSKFHIFDALVIIASFVIDVTTQGTEEELGQLVVVLRLWRLFQIIEELSMASQDSLERYTEELEKLQRENQRLRQSQGQDREGQGQDTNEGNDERNASPSPYDA